MASQTNHAVLRLSGESLERLILGEWLGQ